MKRLIEQFKPFSLIFVVAIVLMLPQVANHALVFGWDSIFHYNRFYETMMQIRQGNFSPLISLYGWPISGRGRIVNAVYGPGFAYFSGLLMLITGSMFKFQIVLGIFISTLAGSVVTAFSIKNNHSRILSVWFGIFYMVCGNTMVWISENAMTGIAMAFLPLILFPVYDIFEDKNQPVHVVKLAVILAILLQVHELTAVFGVLIYGSAVIYYALVTKFKHVIKLLVKLLVSGALYVILTLNFWVNFIVIYSGDKIVRPFVKTNPIEATFFSLVKIGGMGTQFVVSFIALTILIILKAYWIPRTWNSQEKYLSIVAVGFLILSLPIMPWNWLFVHVPAVSIIQFPHRFVNVTIVLLFGSIIVAVDKLQKNQIVIFKYIVTIASVLLIGLQISTLNSTSQIYVAAKKTSDLIPGWVGNVKDENISHFKKAWRGEVSATGLSYLYKGTADYLPTTNPVSATYNLVNKNFVDGNKVSTGQKKLVYQGIKKVSGKLFVPIVVYGNSIVKLNGSILPKSYYQINAVGQLEIEQVEKGPYHIAVSYKLPDTVVLAWVVTIFAWCAITAFFIVREANIFRIKYKTVTLQNF